MARRGPRAAPIGGHARSEAGLSHMQSGWSLVPRRNLGPSWWGAPLAARLEP